MWKLDEKFLPLKWLLLALSIYVVDLSARMLSMLGEIRQNRETTPLITDRQFLQPLGSLRPNTAFKVIYPGIYRTHKVWPGEILK